VLRVLGNHLELDGFDYESPEDVRADALPAAARMALSNALSAAPSSARSSDPAPAGASAAAARSAGGSVSCERIADVPAFFADPLVRHAHALQQTTAARAPVLRASAATLAGLGLSAGASVRVRQEGAEAVFACVLDARLADGVVRLAAGHAASAGLGPMFGPVSLERA
jgi:NADH-quinone oxidoreductase subunit G